MQTEVMIRRVGYRCFFFFLGGEGFSMKCIIHKRNKQNTRIFYFSFILSWIFQKLLMSMHYFYYNNKKINLNAQIKMVQ